MENATQAAGLGAIWERELPQMRTRVKLLQRVADDFSGSRSIEPADQADALDVAHQLAASLAMFDLPEAAAHARAVEATLNVEGMPQPERLQAHVDALSVSLADVLELD